MVAPPPPRAYSALPMAEQDRHSTPEDTFTALARPSHRALRLPKGTPSREMVVSAFHQAFELVGGVPRLALWADANPSDFYKLYARLLPTTAQVELDSTVNITVTTNVPVSQLNHQDIPPEIARLPVRDALDHA